jgi:oligosaccharide repeat unit polymerase
MTWLILISSILTVIVGYLTHFFLSGSVFKTNNLDEYNLKADFKKHEKRFEKVLTILISLNAIGVIGGVVYLSDLITQNNLNPMNPFWYRMFNSLLSKGELGFNLSYSLFSYLILLQGVSIPLSGIYYVFINKKKHYTLIVLALPILFGIITLQRYIIVSSLFYWVITVAIMISFLKNEERKRVRYKFLKHLSYIFFLFVSMIIFVIIVRMKIDQGGFSDKILIYSLESIYRYVSGNIVALDNFIMSDFELKNGIVIFDSFIKWFMRFGILSSENIARVEYKFVDVGSSTMNTYSYIRILYEDFGILGLLSFSYIWGGVTSLATDRLFKRLSLVNLIIVILLSYSFFISFFSFSLHNIAMVVFMISMAKMVSLSLKKVI